MSDQVSQWAVNFSNYLDAFGFYNAGLAWGLAHIDELSVDDHQNIINILTKESTE